MTTFSTPNIDHYKWVIAMLTNAYMIFVQIKLWHVDQSHSLTNKHIKWNGSHMLIIYYDDMWKYDSRCGPCLGSVLIPHRIHLSNKLDLTLYDVSYMIWKLS
jgi:hypothetical protein